MKNHRTALCFAIALTVLLFVSGSGIAFGQGGTGREPLPPPTNP